jgi:hypothetical protein
MSRADELAAGRGRFGSPVDEKLESLRRALRKDPDDVSVAVRLASVLVKAGRFDDAWELLDARDQREALVALATENPRGVLARLRALDYRAARIFMERLEALGLGGHAALVAVASEPDLALSRLASRVLARVRPDALGELRGLTPDRLEHSLAGRTGPHASRQSRGLAHKLIERSGTKQAALLLPWLVPLLTAGEPVLAARALALVRRLTDRDGPPFDPELIARLLAKRDEGEAA